MRPVWRRLSFLGVGCLVAALALEGALQLLAMVVGGDRLTLVGGDEQMRILCVGDSNTFGLYFPAEHSYPKQLERVLNDGLPEPRYAVINAGCPGRSTAAMANELPALLARYQPQVVLVLGGINDRWNDVSSGVTAAAQAPAPSAWRRLAERSRLVKLFKIAWSRLTKESVDSHDPTIADPPRGDPHGEKRSDQAMRETVAATLAHMVGLCRAAAAEPFLITYPAHKPPFLPAQLGTRDAARSTSAPLIDLETSFDGLAAQGEADLLIVDDWHPTVRGYARMAEAIARSLHEQGLVAETPTRLEPVTVVPAPELSISLEPAASPRSVSSVRTLHLQGEPGRSFRVLLASATTPPFTLFRAVVPLARDPLFAASLRVRALAGELDQSGRATVRVDVSSLMRFGMARIYAAAVTFADPDPARHRYLSVRSVSPAIDITPVRAGGG